MRARRPAPGPGCASRARRAVQQALEVRLLQGEQGRRDLGRHEPGGGLAVLAGQDPGQFLALLVKEADRGAPKCLGAVPDRPRPGDRARPSSAAGNCTAASAR